MVRKKIFVIALMLAGLCPWPRMARGQDALVNAVVFWGDEQAPEQIPLRQAAEGGQPVEPEGIFPGTGKDVSEPEDFTVELFDEGKDQLLMGETADKVLGELEQVQGAGEPSFSPASAKASPTVLGVLAVKEADIHEVLNMIAAESGIVIDTDGNVTGKVTIYLKEAEVFDALRIILDMNALAYSKEAPGRVRVMTADHFQSEFGYPFGQSIQTRVVSVEHASASRVEGLLNRVKSERGKVMYDDMTRNFILIDTPESIKEMTGLIQKLDVAVISKTFKLKHQKAKDIAKDIQEISTEDVGRLEFHEEEDSITVTDTPEKMEEITGRVEELDRPRIEILLEAKILQIILNDENQEGVDWEAIVSDFKKAEFEGFSKQDQNGLSFGTVTEEDYAVLLDALDTVGVMNAVSDVKIFARDNGKSRIDIKSSDLLSAYEKEEDRDQALEEVLYHLTSWVADNNVVAVRVKPEILGEENKSGKAEIVTVQDGGTIVIGGLFKEVTVEATLKIPLLGDLPLLGFAFRRQGQQFRRTEVIVFVTPKVIVKE